MNIRSYEDLIKGVQGRVTKPRVAVVAAHDEHTLEAVVKARKDNLITPFLIGDALEIKRILQAEDEDPDAYTIMNQYTVTDSINCAVGLIQEGNADILMKGKLQTSELMGAVVKKENGLRIGGLISLIGVFEIPGYHKLLTVSDIGMNTYPTFEGKRDILRNAVNCLHSLGNEKPKVAVLSSSENVNPKHPDAVDAAGLKRMNQSKEIDGCIIEGPISLDLAVNREAARIKGYESMVAGDADLLIVPDIVSGNVLAKSLLEFGKAQTAGLVLGAKVPIILTSRSASAQDKHNSIALAAYVAAINE